jgi:hypothetical protein
LGLKKLFKNNIAVRVGGYYFNNLGREGAYYEEQKRSCFVLRDNRFGRDNKEVRNARDLPPSYCQQGGAGE